MTPNEIQNKRFDKRMGGYRPEEVHVYLVQVANYLESVLEEKDEMEKKMLVLADKLEEYREDEESMRSALIGAQKLGDNVVREAKKKAEVMMMDARSKAEEIAAEARANVDREAFALSRMQSEVAEFKTRMLDLYKEHIALIQNLPDEYETNTVARETLDFTTEEAQVDEPEAVSAEMALEYEEVEDPPAAKRIPKSEMKLVENTAPESRDNNGGGKQRQKQQKRGGNNNLHQKLRFGEEYNLTRNE